MPTIVMPFAGWRYAPHVVPDLAAVMTPPYDVISDAERAAYQAQSPYSMIHLILGAEAATDSADDNRFTRAAVLLRQWSEAGVLVPEPQPALYVYQQDFTLDGVPLTRTGLIARVRLADYTEGIVFPHEQTFAGPKADLLRLGRACQANLSAVFAVYRDPSQTLEALLASVLQRSPERAVSHWGEGSHRLWALTDRGLIAQVQAALRHTPLVIADGHHRYETALALRQEMRRLDPDAHPDAPYEYVMMTCANIYNPGVVALPTHRVLRGLSVASLADRLHRLPWLQIDAVHRQASERLQSWQRRLEAHLQQLPDDAGSRFTLYAGGEVAYVVTVSPTAAVQQVQVPGVSDAWKRLDVSVLHHALLPALQAADATSPPVVSYARAGEVALDAVAQGEADLVVLMRPTPLEAMMSLAMAGERMPPKSTYFYPKLPTGLVINRLSS